MARPRVFIDGHAGTTGLRVREWLSGRADLELLAPEEGRRKQESARRELAGAADLVVLCLPDEAAREAVAWIDPQTRVIDASSAHRVAEGWTYGLAEALPEQRGRIAASRRVSNAGCYPVAPILGLRPWIDAGLLAADAPVVVRAVSGYTGGGRSMIERWQDPGGNLASLPCPAPYALASIHKHLPEMARYAGLAHEPQFLPSVGAFATGMRVEVPLHAEVLAPGATGKVLWDALHARYADEPFVKLAAFRDPFEEDEWSFDPRACNDTNCIELWVVPNAKGHVLLVGVLDNLGKGAAGNAIQNLNLMLGLPETEGLPR